MEVPAPRRVRQSEPPDPDAPAPPPPDPRFWLTTSSGSSSSDVERRWGQVAVGARLHRDMGLAVGWVQGDQGWSSRAQVLCCLAVSDLRIKASCSEAHHPGSGSHLLYSYTMHGDKGQPCFHHEATQSSTAGIDDDALGSLEKECRKSLQVLDMSQCQNITDVGVSSILKSVLPKSFILLSCYSLYGQKLPEDP